LARASSSVAPWDQQPGKLGAQTANPSSDAKSEILNFMANLHLLLRRVAVTAENRVRRETPIKISLQPRKRRLLLAMGALTEVHVDDVLIGNPRFFRQFLEIFNRCSLDTDGALLLQPPAVGVPFGFAEIILFPHRKNSSCYFR
jgi:hypothetical protein